MINRIMMIMIIITMIMIIITMIILIMMIAISIMILIYQDKNVVVDGLFLSAWCYTQQHLDSI